MQLEEPRYGYAWWAPGAVFVNQPRKDRAEVADAHFVHDLIDQCLASCPDDVAASGGVTIVHDWRALQHYDAAARPAFMARMKNRPPGYLKCAVAVLRPDVSAILRMAVEGANLFAAIALQRDIRVAFDIDAEVARVGVTAPAAGARFPGTPVTWGTPRR